MKFLNRWDEGRRVGAPAMPADQQLSLAHSPHALVACLPFHYFSHQNGCGIKAKLSRAEEVQGLLTKCQEPRGRRLAASPHWISVLAGLWRRYRRCRETGRIYFVYLIGSPHYMQNSIGTSEKRQTFKYFKKGFVVFWHLLVGHGK